MGEEEREEEREEDGTVEEGEREEEGVDGRGGGWLWEYTNDYPNV